MLFRIDIERFLVHAIDHFTLEELTTFQYAIIGTMKNQARCNNIVKANDLSPSSEVQIAFSTSNDKDMLRKEFLKELNADSKIKNYIYKTFINPIITNHYNIMIICKEAENPYVDVILEFIKKEFKLDCIDLNELFIKGRVGPIYIDMDEVRNKAVDVRRAAATDTYRALESTRDGRMRILTTMMTTKEKIKKLKSIGINVTKADMKDLDKLLIESWVEDD